MRRVAVVLLVLAVVGAAGFYGYRELERRRVAAATPDYETVEVKNGDISATVSATGIVQPEREVALAFQSAGTVGKVAVELGAAVEAGQTLATLDTTDLELAVRLAQVGVQQAEAQLRQLQEGPNALDVAAAQSALGSAKSAYAQLLKGTDKDQLAAAQAQVEQARVQMEQAQQVYDRVKDRPDVGLLPQSLQLQQATIAYDTAQAQYRAAARPATQSQLAAAEAQIAQAQANLDRLGRGPTAEQVAVAQAGVDQARLSVEQAQRRLDNAQIKAPWKAIVTAVNAVEGGLAQPGQPAFQLADMSQYHLDVQVDEVDIAGIKADQPVTVEVDALPDERLSGKVMRISPAAVRSATGGVSYEVRLNIDPTSAPLRSGMSATATIISSTRRNVPLIPNRAVQLDRETGRTFVERITPGGDLQKVEVRLGLRDDQQSEVREGLEPNDRLAISNKSGLQRLQETFGGF